MLGTRGANPPFHNLQHRRRSKMNTKSAWKLVATAIAFLVLILVFSQVFGQSPSPRVPKEYTVQKVLADGATDFRMYYKTWQFGSVAYKNGLAAIRLRNETTTLPPGWGATNYSEPSFPDGVMKGVKISKPIARKDGIRVKISGSLYNGQKRVGTFSGSYLFRYHSFAKKASGAGLYSIRLSKPLNVLGLDMTVGKTEGSRMPKVPLLSGGIGLAGDIKQINVDTDQGSFTWDMDANPQYYTGEFTNRMSIEAVGQYNQVDTAAQGYAPINPVLTPTIKTTYTSRSPGLPIIFGGVFDITKSDKFWEDSVGAGMIILKSSTAKKFVFDTTWEATEPVIGGTHTITASAGTGGTISPNGAVIVADGDNQTFTITAGIGNWIAGVQVDGSSVGAMSSYTFSSVTTNHSISVSFTAIPPTNHTITSSAGANGSVTPNGAITVADGGNQTFIFTANPNYQTADVQVDGASVGAVASYDFTNVVADHTIFVTFTKWENVSPSAIIKKIDGAGNLLCAMSDSTTTLYISTNNGDSWSTATAGLGELHRTCLDVDQGNIWVGCYSGDAIAVSTDCGATFQLSFSAGADWIWGVDFENGYGWAAVGG